MITSRADTGTDADQVRRRGLRRMRALAVSLLLFAAVVYLLTRGTDGFLGFVNAGAEASMVGAIADWFAVTALFKHPLGIPVPHTALIPQRKEMLGRSLEEFMADNFLQEPVIRERVAAANPTLRLGVWVSEPANARKVVDEVASLIRTGLERLRDEDVRVLVEEALIPRLVEEPIAPVAGSLLEEIVRDDAHHGVVDLILEEGHRWLTQNAETFTDVVGERAPWWSPPRLNEAVTARIHLEAVRWVADIKADPHHSAREALDSLLAQLARDLCTDPATQERAERFKERVLDHPQIITTGMSLWDAFRRALLQALQDPDGPVRARAQQELVAFGGRLSTDDARREHYDRMASDLAVFVVERYGAELTTVITSTIERWDGKEAARKIELHVGRDLQFIRINGTVVGGLVGVLIHTISLLVG